MSAQALHNLLSQALFVFIFLALLAKVIRRPLRADIDAALLFGMTALSVAIGIVSDALDITPGRAQSGVSGSPIGVLVSPAS